MHYEDKKTGFKFDAVSGVPKENTAEAFEELFAANKAAEEGELVEFASELTEIRDEVEAGRIAVAYLLTDHDKWVIKKFIEAIAADRASRQVANKAEVEPAPYGWVYECLQPFTDGKVWCEFFDRDQPVEDKGVRNIRPLYATPPATTGASTARDQVLEEAANHAECIGTDWLDANDAHKNFAADYIAKSIRALKGSVGASTVLTDERIMELAVEREPAGVGLFDQIKFSACQIVIFARAIEREVAAQAGQVAVPEGFVLAPDEPTDQMTYIGQKMRYDPANSIGSIYCAMLAAAPSPAKESK